VRYDNAQSWTKDSVGALTAQAISNGVTALVNSDMSFPKGLPLPFTRRTIPMTNRLIFNSTVKYITKSSVVNLSDNTDNYGLTSSAEYEVSKNFRLSFGLGYNRYIYRDDAKQNYTSLEASSRLTIQF
jgi:outer membrane protein assembly factor BamA